MTVIVNDVPGSAEPEYCRANARGNMATTQRIEYAERNLFPPRVSKAEAAMKRAEKLVVTLIARHIIAPEKFHFVPSLDKRVGEQNGMLARPAEVLRRQILRHE